MKMFLFFTIILCLPFSGYGAIVGKGKVKGTVVKYDKKTVTLKTNNGKQIKVKRQAIPEHFKLRTGTEVHALLNPEIITKRLKK